MAGTSTIPQLQEALSLTDTWEFPIDSGIQTYKAKLSTLIQTLVNAGFSFGEPVGAIHAFAGASVPTGYLACNGAVVSRETYANLFAAIGETWGAGDGSTTFKLPDFETDNRFLRSSGGSFSVGDYQLDATAKNGLVLSGGVADYSGSKVSGMVSANHTHSTPAHTHNFDYRTIAGLSFSGNDSRYMLIGTSNVSGNATPYMGGGNGTTGTISANHSHTTNIAHGHSNTFALSNGDTETRPNAAVVKFIIKT